MKFIEDKLMKYLLGDSGGKKFPIGEPPDLKTFAKEVLGPDVRLWPMQKLILKTINNTIGQHGMFPHLPYTPWEEDTLAQMQANALAPTDETKYRQAVVRRNAKTGSPTIVLLLIGRGGSKTFMMSLLVAYYIRWLLSWKSPHRRFQLAKVKPIAIQCLAGKESQAVSLFRAVKSHVRNCQSLNGTYEEFKESLNFGNVVEARAYTSNANTVRGEDTFCYYHEEVAYCAEDTPDSEKSFTQCYKAIQPAVKNRFGGEGVMLFPTSAGLKVGQTYRLYRQIKAGLIQNCVLFQLAVWEMNPKYVNGKNDFSQEFAEDPITADAEHGSQFVDATNVFLSKEEVYQPIKEHRHFQKEGCPGVSYWVRLDPSRKHDRYALALGHKEYVKDAQGRVKIVAVVDHVHFWEPIWRDPESREAFIRPSATEKKRLVSEPVNPQVILDYVQTLTERFNIVGVSADQFESQYIIQELEDRFGTTDFPFGHITPVTEKLNWLAARNLKKLINIDCFEIYNEPAWIEEASVAMRYNKNKPMTTAQGEEDFLDEWEEASEDEGLGPQLIYSVAAPRAGSVTTDDVLDAIMFLLFDMMSNTEMGIADLSALGSPNPRTELQKVSQILDAHPLSEMPKEF